jgi:hypothetical protein
VKVFGTQVVVLKEMFVRNHVDVLPTQASAVESRCDAPCAPCGHHCSGKSNRIRLSAGTSVVIVVGRGYGMPSLLLPCAFVSLSMVGDDDCCCCLVGLGTCCTQW